MSDIDFDELDAAVASVLNKDGGVQPGAPQATAPQPAELPITVKPPAVNAADLHKPAPPAPRGRFLDMVHPSVAGARPAALSPAAAKPVVSPAAAPVFATEPVLAPVPASPPSAPATVPAAGIVAPKPPVPVAQPPAAEQPAAQNAAATPAADSEPANGPKDFFAASPDDSAPHEAPNVPPVSPFIPDAKVEKRPLGGGPADVAASPPVPVAVPDDAVHAAISKIESENNLVPEPEAVVPAPAANTTAPESAPTHTPAPATAMAPETRPDRSIQPLNPVEAPAFFTHKAPAQAEPDLPKHGKGTLIWLTVGVAILLIGFGVGASLYFTVFR